MSSFSALKKRGLIEAGEAPSAQPATPAFSALKKRGLIDVNVVPLHSVNVTGESRRRRRQMIMRDAVLYTVLALSLSCGDSNTPLTPTSPLPQPAPAPSPAPPPPTIANISGQWAGTHELQFQGMRQFGTIALALDQTDRNIRGTWRHTYAQPTPGFNPWHGDITGTVLLTEMGETRFAGTATIVAEIQGGTGACHGTVPLEGPSSASSMRWTGPNVTFTNCQNVVGGFVWIVHR